MKDLHSHIMYGIDDGAKSKEESIEILKNAYKNGITDIVLTPHYIKDTKYKANNNQKTKIMNELKKELKKNDININLYIGNEVYIDENIISLYKEISTINNSRYILIELPLTTKYPLLEEVLCSLKENNLVPIIAHPERYIAYYKNFNFFAKLLNDGCLFQGNIGSLYGKYGKKSKKMLKELLKRNMLHFLGSDIHHANSDIYTKNITKDLTKIIKNQQKVDDLLMNNANKVIKNENIIDFAIGVNKMNESSIVKDKINIDINTTIKQITKILYLVTKRIFDICISIIGLLISFPIFIIVIILIKKEDNGKAIYSHDRIGKNGQIFKLYKFRSMINDADEVLKEMLKDPKLKEEYKKNMKFENDPRVTKIGKFIRKTSIDELPQLINVLKGDMSLIGNRPYLPREKDDIGIYYEDIVKTKPGITGYWQVSGRSNVTFKERCQMESYYSNNFSLLLDIKIFFLTFYVVLFRKGAE